ncbi:hypothetical protein N1851_022601 [Merluccius polli]|uniref:SEA domain-containing protein n=1 Tax=Merluccius polli TaxID=89951 RepID=A0AA47MHZ4_MERPO|nr:hypothetical protein N1851_022601 [Merluccius polli]
MKLQESAGSIITNMTLVFQNQSVVPSENITAQTLEESLTNDNTNLDVDTSTVVTRIPPTAEEGTVDLTFSLSCTFTSALSDPTSTAFKTLANEVTREVNKGYRRRFPFTFLRSVIRSFSNGSIIADLKLVFQNQSAVPSENSSVQALKDSLSSGITTLDVDTSTIVASKLNTRIKILE